MYCRSAGDVSEVEKTVVRNCGGRDDQVDVRGGEWGWYSGNGGVM